MEASQDADALLQTRQQLALPILPALRHSQYLLIPMKLIRPTFSLSFVFVTASNPDVANVLLGGGVVLCRISGLFVL
jgi:hypothetical protein